MTKYTSAELTEALKAVNSIIHKCEKAQEKFPEGNAHHTLLKNRLKAMYISKDLITQSFNKIPKPLIKVGDCDSHELFSNLELLHITPLGIERIRKNLALETEDVVCWCKDKIQRPDSHITRAGKNWYVYSEGCKITVNGTSYTIITAHIA